MSSHKQAAAVFRDFEKLYRLSGLYKGNAEQLRKQLSFVDNNLEANFRAEFGRSGSLRFDLLMSAVYYDGDEVFRAKTPEFTISYALFYEGIKSVSIKGGVTSQELFEFISTVKEVLSGDNEEQDLASVLWRRSTPNIKVSLYNLFTESGAAEEVSGLSLDEDSIQEFEREFEKEVYQGEFVGKKTIDESWEEHDLDWELPSGDLFVAKMGAMGSVDSKAADRLKAELSDASYSDRAKNIIRFSSKEVGALKAEMESFDENQVQFNTLIHLLPAFETPGLEKAKKLHEFLSQSIKGIVKSVIGRFHGGLILFSLDRFKKWNADESLRSRHEVIIPELVDSLVADKNLEVLGEAFGASGKLKIAQELLEYCSSDHFQRIFSHLVYIKNRSAQKNFLLSLLKRGEPLEQLLPGWDEENLMAGVSIVAEFDWEERNTFLLRCLRMKKPKIVDQILSQISVVEMQTGESGVLFGKLSAGLKRRWLESLLKAEVAGHWRGFVKKGIETDLWRQDGEEMMALWVALAFKYLERQAFNSFEEYIRTRRWVLWPKFSQERSVILEVALSQRSPAMKTFGKDIFKAESGVFFQSAELKEKLKANS